MQNLAVFKNQFVSFFTYSTFGVGLFVLSPLWRYYSFLHFSLAKKQNVNNLMKQIKSIIIKNGDVLILAKITRVKLY